MNPNFVPNFNSNGMNFINANPNGMNNENFQLNLMNNYNYMMIDENTMRVRIIVEPYEKKIKELEEIIRQKDFEISVLKDKLFNFNQMQGNNNMPNYFNNNMNNQMINFVEQNNMEKKEINIKFIDENNKETIIKFRKCALTRKLLEKYLYNTLSDWKNYKFIFNDNLLIPGFTLDKNHLTDNSIIYVKNKDLFCLFFDYEGNIVSLILDENTPVCMAIIYFLLDIDREDLIVDLINNEIPLYIIFNARNVNVNEKKSIKQYFKHNNTKILIRIKNNIRG